MKTYKEDKITLCNEERSVAGVIESIKYNIERNNNSEAMACIASLKNHADATGDKELKQDALILEKEAGGYGPFPSAIINPADTWNMPVQSEIIMNKKGEEKKKVYLKKGHYSNMLQVLQCAHDAGWFQYLDGSTVTNREDTVYSVGILFGHSFDNVYKTLYKTYSSENYLEVFYQLENRAKEFKKNRGKKEKR